MRWLAIIGLCVCAIVAPPGGRADEIDVEATDDDAPANRRVADREQTLGLARLAGIAREAERLGDWNAVYEAAAPGIDEFWQKQGWDEEADLYALRILHEVASIPPWEFQQRIEHMSRAVRARYDLSQEQYEELQTRTYQMVGALVWRHGRTIFQQTREAVQTRLAGQPFTPEQVARWTREATPIIDEGRTMFEQIGQEISQDFTPEQLDIYKRDVASYRRRMAAMNEMRQRWERGEWQPEDWGLQHDPLHQHAARTASAKAPAPQKPEDAARKSRVSPVLSAFDETTWARYVRRFVERYSLDDAQAIAAWSILHELEDRAAVVRRARHRDALVAAQHLPGEALANAQISQLFEELVRRLHPIPTEGQRRRAELAAARPSEAEPRWAESLPTEPLPLESPLSGSGEENSPEDFEAQTLIDEAPPE